MLQISHLAVPDSFSRGYRLPGLMLKLVGRKEVETNGSQATAGTLSWSFYLLLSIASFGVMAPVLLHPHWGMFSDPNQIILMCRQIYANGFDWHLCFLRMWADFRPGFHILDIALWCVSPNSPQLFYLLRAFCFAMTVNLTFANCKLLSRSNILSFGTALIWLVAYPTCEVIYTLDKGEVFLGLLFSSAIWLNLSVAKGFLTALPSRSQLIARASALFFVIAYAIFTKETGLLMVGYGLCVAAFSIFNQMIKPPDVALGKQSLLSRFYGDATVRWSVLVFLLAALAAALHKILFLMLGGLKFKYGETVFDPSFLYAQLTTYVQAIPDLFGPLVFSCIILVTLYLISLRRQDSDASFGLTQSLCLVLTTLAGAVAMCSWKYKLIYIWYPLFAMLLPSLSYTLSRARDGARYGSYAVLALFVCCLIPYRLFDAQAQFFMDSAFDQTMDALAHLPEKIGADVNVVVKMKDKASLEIGEEVDAAIAERRSREVGAAVVPPGKTVRVYNLIRNASGILADDLKSLAEDAVPEPGFKARPGVDKYVFFKDQMPHWRVNNVKVGDLLLVPFGTVPANLVPYRGVLCFAKPVEALPQSLPQLHLMPFLNVEMHFFRPGQSDTKMGWSVFKVTESPSLALPLGDYGWFSNNGLIYFGSEMQGKTLTLKSKVSLVKSLAIEQDGVKRLESLESAPGSIKLPLGKSGVMKVSANGAFDKAVLFQLTDVSL